VLIDFWQVDYHLHCRYQIESGSDQLWGRLVFLSPEKKKKKKKKNAFVPFKPMLTMHSLRGEVLMMS